MSILINYPISFSIFYSILIIAVFYTHKYVAPSISQNAFRMISFFLFTILSLILCKINGLMNDIYFWHENFLSKNCIISTIMLFLGPIIQNLFNEYNFISNGKKHNKKFDLNTYIKNQLSHFTNFYTFKQVFFGPFCEEIIYRVLTCSLWMKSGISLGRTVWFSPLIFGLSHFHHYFEHNRERRYLIASLFQIGYTTLFGWWAAYLWCRTRNFLAIWFIHAFCNFMEFPDFASAYKWRYDDQKIIIHIGYLFGVIYFLGIIGMMLTTQNSEE